MKEEVTLFQEISTNAWPAMNLSFLNGWIIRLGDGYTRRANSVLPLRYSGKNIDKDIKVVEDFYKKYNLPSVFQIPDYCEPNNLKKILLKLDYQEIDESILMASEISILKEIPINDLFSYTLEIDFSEKFFSNFGRLTNRSSSLILKNQNIIKRILFSKAFAIACKQNEVIGLCLGVLEREHIGIYDMFVSPEYRRQGIGKALLNELILWGKNNGATTAYLQVQGDNSGAIALYKKIGLTDRYHYRYLVKKFE
ncbi:MAG TPA: GNAT family N-acetyltransferase [candidate division Zixibacteria bacterium]|nr:GNAT family N-acetyltransferase [candidate division Zixibacteria bacterium]